MQLVAARDAEHAVGEDPFVVEHVADHLFDGPLAWRVTVTRDARFIEARQERLEFALLFQKRLDRIVALYARDVALRMFAIFAAKRTSPHLPGLQSPFGLAP